MRGNFLMLDQLSCIIVRILNVCSLAFYMQFSRSAFFQYLDSQMMKFAKKRKMRIAYVGSTIEAIVSMFTFPAVPPVLDMTFFCSIHIECSVLFIPPWIAWLAFSASFQSKWNK